MKKALQVAVILALGIHAEGQGTFQNLDFESANVGASKFAFSVPVSEALPYWTVTTAGVPQTDVSYNGFSTGATVVSLIGPGGPVLAIDGNYDVLLAGSFSGSASISQTGLIPSGTKSLLFAAQPSSAFPAGTIAIMVGSQIVPITPVASEPTYTEYGANISAWAGQTEQLTFSSSQTTGAVNPWFIDNISFSPNAVVPEPSPFALMGFGGLLFTGYRRFGPNRAL